MFIGVRVSNGGKVPEFLHAFESALSILGTVILFMHLYCSLLCDWYFFFGFKRLGGVIDMLMWQGV